MPAGTSHNSEIRLVVFDLGRVLIRICDSWAEASRRAGFPLTEDDLNKPVLHDIAVRHDMGELSSAGFIEAVSPIVQLSPEQVRSMSCAFLYAPYPGGTALIDDLHRRGLSTACLSNTNDTHWQIMNDPSQAAHFPLHHLTHRFASHLIRARKPDAAIYEYLERQTGIEPGAIIFFDDVEANIAAAHARGWQGHVVHPKSPDPIAFMREKLRGHGVL